MKNFFFNLFAFYTFALFSQTAQAQAISPADQKGIEACYNGFMAAFEKMDPTGIGALLTESAEHIVPNGEIVRGRSNVVASMAGFMEFLKTQPKPDHFAQKNLNWQSRYVAQDVILSTYTEETTQQFGDKTTVEKLTTAILLRKIGDKWLADMISLTPVVAMPGEGK